MLTHEYWRDTRSGEIWAVRLRDGVVVGCCGPLHHDDVDRDYLDDLDFSETDVARIEAERAAFALVVDT